MRVFAGCVGRGACWQDAQPSCRSIGISTLATVDTPSTAWAAASLRLPRAHPCWHCPHVASTRCARMPLCACVGLVHVRVCVCAVALARTPPFLSTTTIGVPSETCGDTCNSSLQTRRRGSAPLYAARHVPFEQGGIAPPAATSCPVSMRGLARLRQYARCSVGVSAISWSSQCSISLCSTLSVRLGSAAARVAFSPDAASAADIRPLSSARVARVVPKLVCANSFAAAVVYLVSSRVSAGSFPLSLPVSVCLSSW